MIKKLLKLVRAEITELRMTATAVVKAFDVEKNVRFSFGPGLSPGQLARAIADEVIDVQEWLTQAEFQRKKLIDSLAECVYGDPHHRCRGRAAQGRLTRLLDIADEAGLQVPRIRDIKARLAL